VLADYASDKLTPEMAVGHSLQHIDLLYAALKASLTVPAGPQEIPGLEAALGQ